MNGFATSNHYKECGGKSMASQSSNKLSVVQKRPNISQKTFREEV